MFSKDNLAEIFEKNNFNSCTILYEKSKDEKRFYFLENEGCKYVLKFYPQVQDWTILMKIYDKFENPEISCVPQVFDKGVINNCFYVLEEFVEGRTFTDYIYKYETARAKEKDEIEILKIIRIFKNICDAVELLHNSYKPRIIHADLSSNNIIFEEEKYIRLIDFDISYIEGEKNWKKSGTPNYIAPETQNDDELCIQTDIYALGSLLEEWVSKWNAKSHPSMANKPNNILDKICRKCKENKPEDRYSDVNELKKALFELEIAVILTNWILNIQPNDNSIYTYANGSADELNKYKRKIMGIYFKSGEIISGIENKNKDLCLIFSTTAMYSIRKKDKENKIGRIKFDSLILFVQDYIYKNDKMYSNYLAIDQIDENDFHTSTLLLKSIDSTSLCDLIEKIIMCREGIYDEKVKARYYSFMCNFIANIINSEEEVADCDKWWKIIIALGERARELEIKTDLLLSCETIMGQFYENQILKLKNDLIKSKAGMPKEEIKNKIKDYEERKEKYNDRSWNRKEFTEIQNKQSKDLTDSKKREIKINFFRRSK